MKSSTTRSWVFFILLAWLGSHPLPGRAAAALKLELPLQRAVYQANEWIDVSVVRSSPAALAAGELALRLKGEDGSEIEFLFPVKGQAPTSGAAQTVEHLHLNGWLLRPGKYTLETTCDGALASAPIEIFNPLRRTSFKLINWGRATDADRLPQGEDNLGFNLFYGGSGLDDAGNFIRAGVDHMGCCVMSGGHQMDLRQECDWSDPYVIRGASWRTSRRAFMDRTRPNVPGVHFYDEPGLTWTKDPQTGEATPHTIPSQLWSYEAAFGQPPLPYRQVDPANPDHAARWAHWARWKLGFMDAAWQDAQFGVSWVRPGSISVTQSQYGYSAFTDGYYFTVVRSLPVISGHGGYHDFGPGYFNPVVFLEFARARDFSRPNWYLPTWYDSTTPDVFRLEQYLSFQCNLQGMISPPDLDPAQPSKSKAAQGIVESNHLMARLGPVFDHLPVTRPPVAVLFSLSQFIHAQTLDRTANYAHSSAHGRNVPFVYLAGKITQQPYMIVLDEDVLDGTLMASHKAVILTSVDYLDPPVIAALERFAKNGGLVLVTADSTVKLAGAVVVEIKPGFPATENLKTLAPYLAAAQTVAAAVKPHLEKAGIKPILAGTEPGIVATRQASGDLEYLFAVNASHDPASNPMTGLKAVTTRIAFDADSRPVYDAIQGGSVRELATGGISREGQFRFGPGQMRVFARTTRPIGGIKVATPTLVRDYTRQESPLVMRLSASVLDDNNRLLNGAFPLRLRVTDPLGDTRFDLYRATDNGLLQLDLPQAINDPSGRWQVTATDLLSQTQDNATFELPATVTCAIAAGATWRAVHLAQDQDNIFRFFRLHQDVTIVTGNADFHAAAAERLVKILAPWNVRCVITNAAAVNQSRTLSESEARTWVGMDYAGSKQIKAGNQNDPKFTGFVLRGPAILLGTPEDNPLVKYLANEHFLPYAVSINSFPGPGRGLVAWQWEGLGIQQESITLLAYDEAGLAEAVGTMYEMLAGMKPLTPLAQPNQSTVKAAQRGRVIPTAGVAWSTVLSDRIVGLKSEADKLRVWTHAGVVAEVGRDGKIQSQTVLEAGALEKALQELNLSQDPAQLAEAQKKADPRRRVKFIATGAKGSAVAYWGGAVQTFSPEGKRLTEQQLDQDPTALIWSGNQLIVGDADGRLIALKAAEGL